MTRPRLSAFVVDRVSRSNAPGLHGWNCITTGHDTEAEARAEFNKPLTGREYKAVLYRNDNGTLRIVARVRRRA